MAAEPDPADSQWPSLPSQPAAQPQQGSRGAAEPQQGGRAAAEPQQGSWAAAEPVVTKPQPAAKPGDWGAIAEQTLGLAHSPAAEPGWGSVGAPQQQEQPQEKSGWGGNDHAGNAHRAAQQPSSQQGASSQGWGAPERSVEAPERWGGAPERSGANGTATVVRAGDWAAAVSDQPRANGWGLPSQPAQQPSAAESGGWGEAGSAAASQQSWSEGRVLSICLAWKKDYREWHWLSRLKTAPCCQHASEVLEDPGTTLYLRVSWQCITKRLWDHRQHPNPCIPLQKLMIPHRMFPLFNSL